MLVSDIIKQLPDPCRWYRTYGYCHVFTIREFTIREYPDRLVEPSSIEVNCDIVRKDLRFQVVRAGFDTYEWDMIL